MPEQEHSVRSIEPTASRPRMPAGYGIPNNSKGMLRWRQVDEWLEKALIYWLATASPDGKPHATPIWGTWVDGVFYFGGDSDTIWARNLAANPRIVVHIESDGAAVMLEGTVEVWTPEPTTLERMADQSEAKYKYRPESAGEGIYALRPSKVLAWDNNNFARTATRWRLGEG